MNRKLVFYYQIIPNLNVIFYILRILKLLQIELSAVVYLAEGQNFKDGLT